MVLDFDEFEMIAGIEILDLSAAYSATDIKDVAHLNSADEERLIACLHTLNRMRLTSSALTDESEVQVGSQGVQTLESC